MHMIRYLGDHCIQNFNLGRYIVEYTVGNLVLWRRVSRAVKHDFRTYIPRYTSPNENFEYGYPHSNAHLNFYIMTSSFKQYIAGYTSQIYDVIHSDIAMHFQVH